MKTEQFIIRAKDNEIKEFSFNPDLILLFVSSSFKNIDSLKIFRKRYPDSVITGCSTSGEVEDINVHDHSVVATAVKFDKARVEYNEVYIASKDKSRHSGTELVEKFEQEGLKHLFVLSEGLNVNGSYLVDGLRHQSNQKYSITGGFSSDGTRFEETFVITDELEFRTGMVVGVGFYGDDLKVGYGALGGWDSFGVDRIITKAKGNVLYEIDGEPVLDLYKNFLGDQAKNLPASGMLFPLSLRLKANNRPVVRTVISYSEKDKSLTFGGNVQEGAIVRLMKANMDRLINAAEGAAELSIEEIGNTHTDFAIIISSVGRRMVLNQLIEEEVEAVRDVIGEDAIMTGFYSYGEISPYISGTKCELHNQTMSLTTFSESNIDD
ncbi:MAG: FIST C-terminal domain-containing protein [Flavobacteriales bacterium]|nr:FIST C-terminal domain-containing protein [Flavobacteriales bacterium]